MNYSCEIDDFALENILVAVDFDAYSSVVVNMVEKSLFVVGFVDLIENSLVVVVNLFENSFVVVVVAVDLVENSFAVVAFFEYINFAASNIAVMNDT